MTAPEWRSFIVLCSHVCVRAYLVCKKEESHRRFFKIFFASNPGAFSLSKYLFCLLIFSVCFVSPVCQLDSSLFGSAYTLPVCLPVCLSVCLPACLPVCLSVSQSVSQSVCLSVCLSVVCLVFVFKIIVRLKVFRWMWKNMGERVQKNVRENSP